MNRLSIKLFTYCLFIFTFQLGLLENAASQCVFSVSSTNVILPAEGGSEYVFVDSGSCEDYSVSSTDGWIYYWMDYYEHILTIYADPNHVGYRTGSITVHDYWNNEDIVIYVSQDWGCVQLPSPGDISGASSVCAGGSATFSINPVSGADLYHWTVNGTSLNQYGTSVYITFSAGISPSTITACAYNACGDGILTSKQVTLYFVPTGGSITGDQVICQNSDAGIINNSSYPTLGSGSYSYQWQYSTNGGSAWSDISGATGISYDPPVLSVVTQYRRKVIDNMGCGIAYSNVITKSFYASLTGGTITGDNTTCYGYVAGSVSNLYAASSGSGSYSYSWEKSVNQGGSWSYAGGNTLGIDAGSLTTTTWFKRRVTDNICGTVAYSNTIIKTVRNPINPGTISSDEVLCYNANPNIINGNNASGGTNSFSYSWEKSEDGGNNWMYLGGGLSYDPSNLTTTTIYRRNAIDNECGSSYSNIVTKTISQPLTGGSISNSNPQTICYNTDAPLLTNSSSATGGTNSFSYQWQSSINGGATWSDLAGATSTSFDPSALTLSTNYRRRATDNSGCGVVYSNTLLVSVFQQLLPGSISGDNTSCFGYVAGLITNQNSAGNGSGSLSYSWEKSTDQGNNWSLAGGNYPSIDAGILTSTTSYRRKVTDNVCLNSIYTNNVIKTVRNQINPGIIESNEELCFNEDAALMTGTYANGGSNNFVYNWEESEDGLNWSLVQDSSFSFDPGQLTSSRFYRRNAIDDICGSEVSNIITKTVYKLNPGTISGNQTINYNIAPTTITSVEGASGNFGTFSYQWQESTNQITWNNIDEATEIGHEPGNLISSTFYRRTVSDLCGTAFSNIVAKTWMFSEVSYISQPDINRPIDTSLYVGTTQGDVSTTQLGGLAYSIPIFCSPGTNGVQPSLSIQYNSQSGNGLLGWGWNINAPSSISRTVNPYYHGNVIRPISMLSGDEYALDGNRLVRQYGTQGLDDSRYKTEQETFTETTIHGSVGNGPAWFEVKDLKARTMLEYGNAKNAYLENDQNTRLAWFLTKSTDRNGNYIKYNYSKDQYSGQVFLHSIQYTGNDSADLEPYNEILFQYERRYDPFTIYQAGVKIENAFLISKITIKCEGSVVRTYSFGYAFDFYSRLISITETSDNGESYNSTIFSYDEVPQTTQSLSDLTTTGYNKFVFSDFNGDGKSDMVVIPDKTDYSSSDKVRIYFNQNGTDFQLQQEIPINTYALKINSHRTEYLGHFNGGAAVDFNGDGLSDFYTTEIVDNILNPAYPEDIQDRYQVIFTFYYFSSTGDSLVKDTVCKFFPVTLEPLSTWTMIPADLDGNGKSDKFYFKPDESEYLIELSGIPAPISGYLGSGLIFDADTDPIDFNGDGKAEIIVKQGDNTLRIFGLVNTQFTSIGNPVSLNYGEYCLGDINGDGKTDIFGYNQTGCKIYFSDGEKFLSSDFFPMSFFNNGNFQISDLNGDGKADIIRDKVDTSYVYVDNPPPGYYVPVYNTNPVIYAYYFNGNSFLSDSIVISSIEDEMYNVIPVDLNGDGQNELWLGKKANNVEAIILKVRPNDKSRLIKSIADGFNNISRISYGSLPQTSTYNESTRAFTFPVIKCKFPIYLVENIKRFGRSESAPFSNLSYQYQDLKAHVQGKSILGFSKITSIDSVSKARIESCYGLEPAHHIVFTDKTRQYQNNVFISETTDTIAVHTDNSGERFFSYNPLSITENKLNGTKVQVSSSIDQFGNLSNRTTYYKSAGGSTVKQVVEAFSSYDNNGNPGAITVTSTRKLESIARTKNIFYNSFGNVDSIVQLFTGAPSVIATFDYDIFGNITTEKTVCDSRSRIATMVYEPIKGRFVTSKTNALDHSVFFSHDPATGNVLKDSTHTGIVTSYQYDGFGKLEYSQISGMPEVNTTRAWSLNDEGAGETFYEMVSSQNSPAKKTYYDYAGREIRSKSQSFDGTYLVTDKEYDSRGRLVRSYHPYFEGSERDQYITYTYDSINRILTETKVPGNIITAYTYYDNDLKAKVTSGGKDYYKQNDASGMLFKATDPGGSIIYQYNAEDKVDTISSPSGLTRITYDPYGNQDKLYDLDAGEIDYNYNGLGELITQEDNKGNIMTNQYDTSGRIIRKSWTGGETTTYSYYPENEMVKRIASTGGAKIFTYDNLNRLLTKTDSIEGTLFTAEYSYNPQGKIDTVIYNSSVAVANNYNNFGYLDQIKVNNQIIWSAQSMNRYGAINQFALGNQAATKIMYDSNGFIDSILTIRTGSYIQRWGYDFNTSTGNLTQRTGLDSSGGIMQETFTYDDLNRLTSFILSNDTISISYEASGTGNIESKSDVGDYDYTGGLHNVQSIQNPTELMLSLPKHEADYTRFNKISYLRDSISAVEERRLYLTYGHGEQRVKTIYMVNSDTIKTKYFALGNYEKEIDSAGITRELYYISGPSGLTAILQRSESQDSIFYVHTDYLGSYDVVTTSSGTIRQRYNFDPWGRRRNPLDWTYSTDSLAFLFDRGFTGHEHLDQFGLINMNGRVYDPLLAMFLSPDNYVQNPSFTQNFNRYSYAFYSPLKYTDPDGQWVLTALITLGNMWLNGAMANNFEFNPAKWDWRSISTYTSMAQGGYSGWQMGSKVENKVNSFLYRKRFDRSSDMIINDFNRRFELKPNNTYAEGYIASLEGVYTPEFFMRLGPNEPFITGISYEYHNYKYGKYDLRLQVYGSMYDEYNWIQTANWGETGWGIDPNDWKYHGGFYYNRSDINLYGVRYKKPDADFFFQDAPNAEKFDAQLTLCGRRGESWYPIQTFDWGYEFDEIGIVNGYFHKASQIFEFHRQNINNTLNFFNLNHSILP